jgi:anti-sigma28 factor (negative regulator of flagellin synthesis)
MKRKKLNSPLKISLIKRKEKPIAGVRFMQIGNITTSTSFSAAKTTSSQAGNVTSDTPDQAVLNFSANSFSSLVKEASQMPDVRSELVDAFKARIHAGHYPAQDVIDGLTRLIGGAVLQQARSSSSSQKG